MGFWLGWLIIPELFELIPALVGFVRNYFWRNRKLNYDSYHHPWVTIIIPVYNSAETLGRCLSSIAHSTYPNRKIEIICANNQSSDDSLAIFYQVKQAYPTLHMSWINTPQGKSKALNSAIYYATGEYVINIDSDGYLERHAISRMVKSFIANPEVAAMTGAILIDREKMSSKFGKRLLQTCEYFEYGSAFLAGRTIESEDNRLFTMSGSFSAFRRNILLQTKQYNSNTVGEDTEMTFQLKYRMGLRVAMCPGAIFYAEPISGLNELYLQRQRWQRGEIEVVHDYMSQSIALRKAVSNNVVLRLIVDHTISFLKFTWLVAVLALIPMGYSVKFLGISYLLMYVLYLFVEFLNFLNVYFYLKAIPEERRFYLRHFYIIFIIPFYNLLTSFYRMIGILNTITSDASWSARSGRSEIKSLVNVVKDDLNKEKTRYGKKDL